MKKLMILLAVLGISMQAAFAGEGMLTLSSAFDVKTTADRFEKLVKEKGLTLFARISHSDGAAKVGLELRPTEVIIFGNPKVGTPLMLCAQSTAIDLPQKVLIWLDEKGQTWLAYNDPIYLAQRHNISGCDAAIKKISTVLSKLAHAAGKQEGK